MAERVPQATCHLRGWARLDCRVVSVSSPPPPAPEMKERALPSVKKSPGAWGCSSAGIGHA